MTIDELQKRFNELRGKKWRTVIGHVKAEFIGFIFGSAYPFFIQLETGKFHCKWQSRLRFYGTYRRAS